MAAAGAAARFGVGVATAILWVRRWRESGARQARRQGKPGGSKLDAHEGFLFGLVEGERDITLGEMRARLIEGCGVSAGIGTIWRLCDARGITVKKDGPRQRTGARRREGCARSLVRRPARSRP